MSHYNLTSAVRPEPDAVVRIGEKSLVLSIFFYHTPESAFLLGPIFVRNIGERRPHRMEVGTRRELFLI